MGKSTLLNALRNMGIPGRMCRVIVVFPKRRDIISDITTCVRSQSDDARSRDERDNSLDSHEADTGEYAHDGKQLPELKVHHEVPATNIYTVRTIHINTALH